MDASIKNLPVVCGVDLASGQNKLVVVCMQDNKMIATFEGPYAIVKACAWAKARNLKMSLETKY